MVFSIRLRRVLVNKPMDTNDSSQIEVMVNGQTLLVPAGTSEAELLRMADAAMRQEEMGAAPSMGAGRMTPRPSALNLGAGEIVGSMIPSAAETAAAVGALALSGGRPRPGMIVPPEAMRQTLARFATGGLAAGGTRAGIEGMRPFVTGEPSRFEAVAPAAVFGGSVARPTLGLAPAGVVPGAVALGKEGGYQGAVGAMAGAAEEMATGRAPTLEGMSYPAAIGAAAGAFLGAPAVYGQQLKERAGQLIKNANAFIDSGIKQLTPAMVDPQRYGREEARRLRTGLLNREGNDVVDRVQSVYAGLDNGLAATAGARAEGAAIHSAVRERVMTVPELKRNMDAAVAAEAESLARKEQARKALEVAENAATRLLTDESKRAHQAAIAATRDANDRTFAAQMQRLVEEARMDAAERIVQTGGPIETPEMRQRFISRIVEPVMATYDNYFKDSYSLLPEKQAFNPKPMIAEVKRIKASIPGADSGLNAAEHRVLDTVIAELAGTGKVKDSVLLDASGKPIAAGMEMLNINQLRNIRDALYNVGRIGEITTANRTKIKKLGHFVGSQIDEQADAVYGPELGQHLRGINRDYAQFRELQDVPGFDVLFSADATDSSVKSLVDGLLENGPKSEKYAGIVSFIENLAAPKQGGQVIRTPSGMMLAQGTSIVAPQLAAGFKGQLNSLIQGNLIQRAQSNGMVDNTALAGLMKKVGNHNGMAEMLGFSKSDIDSFVAVLNDFPDAGRLSVQDMETYLSNPYFRKALEQRGQGIASVVRLDLADRAVTERMNQVAILERTNNVAEARRMYSDAERIARENGMSADGLRAKYNDALSSPAYLWFGPGRRGAEGQINPETYSTVLKSLFDPAAGATTNRYVQNVFSYLRGSKDRADKELKQQLQSAYIRDYLNLFQTEARPGMMGQLPSPRKLAELNKPMAGSPASAELQRAKIVLEPEQYDMLQRVAVAGEMMRKYERSLPSETGRPEKGLTEGKANRTLYGSLLKGVDAIADAIRTRNYDAAMQGLMNPKEYANRFYANGQWLTFGTRAAETVPASTEMEMRRRQEQRQQVPASLMRFAPATP